MWRMSGGVEYICDRVRIERVFGWTFGLWQRQHWRLEKFEVKVMGKRLYAVRSILYSSWIRTLMASILFAKAMSVALALSLVSLVS
jgi:hypothetical protein